MCQIDGIISKCLEYDYQACALVDKNVLSASMTFKKACLKNNIKPIIGMDIDLLIDERVFEILLISKNDEGFKNLMGLSSFINTNDDKVVTIDILNKYRKDNLLVFYSDNSPLSVALEKNEDIEKALNLQNELFKEYAYGLCNHDIQYNKKRDEKLKIILKDNNIFYFAFNRTLYLNPEDNEEFEILNCIKDKKTISDINVLKSNGRHFLSFDEYNSLFTKDEIENADKLADSIEINLDFKTELPLYQTKDNVSSFDYLKALCQKGLGLRLNNKITKSYKERLDYELEIISNMHFENYFLIVYDFILYAKKHDIFVGPGRGSAAGSLTAYCLGITDIDPIKYGLLFERFLNPERITMPDIDTDFPDDRRDEVVNYVKEKYGIDHVGHIITYGTLKAKQVLRDVARVLEYPTTYVDSLNKLIPFDPNGSLEKFYNEIPLFRQRIESEDKYKKLYNIALKLENAPRHESTHAAGIVFSRKPLQEVVPLCRIESDLYSTQYTMEHLEEMGLIKMDFLGLKNLSIIAEIVNDIKKINPSFDIKKIALDDSKTFKLIDDVNLLGVFQLESAGMINLARKMKPKSFEELSMMIALFRPGPMENIPQFLENRANPSKVSYLHEALRPILSETYGIIIYQEQIMTIARVLANFSYAKADVLRRAMSKKKASELEKLSNDFIEGCVSNNIERKIAEELYELILKFANYGFNKSHSIAYGLVAYQMSYLKANYPEFFYKALLNGTIGSESKTYDYLHEALRVGQTIKPISLNLSELSYIIKDNEIFMPFTVCKDVGSISAKKIIDERNKGPFINYLDTVVRLTNASVEKNVIENLIYAGAFDELKLTRTTMIKNLEKCIKYANAHKGITLDLDFDDSPRIEEYSDNRLVLCEYEKNVYGFYFSYNPIVEIKNKYNIKTLSLRQLNEIRGYQKGFGIIKRIKKHKTKKGDMMAFVDLYDDTGEFSLAIMPDLFQINQTKLNEGFYIYFEGSIDKEGSCLVKKLQIKDNQEV